MLENRATIKPPEFGPPCFKCKGPTRYRTCMVEPVSGKARDIYTCGICENLTFVPVTDDSKP